MKRVGFIFEEICSEENVLRAIYNASNGKRRRRSVKRILKTPEVYAARISKILSSGEYSHGLYGGFQRKDPSTGKIRDISVPRFYPDQIVHWAVMQVVEPIIEKGSYEFSCGNIKGRGVHYGRRYIERVLKNDRKKTQNTV